MKNDQNDLLDRIEKLEEAVFGDQKQAQSKSLAKKTISLAELARSEKLANANGQQKITAIIGYYEVLKGEGSSKPEKIQSGWKFGKFSGKCNSAYLTRAVGDLVRNLENGEYDLTQKGEDFFTEIMSDKR